MYFRKGYLVFKPSGAPPAMIHWTAFVLALIVGGLSFQPGVWLGVFVIILVHEFGHAIAVWRAGATVTAICMDGTGGNCQWIGSVTRVQKLAIVWGGIIAQLLLWVIAFIASIILSESLKEFSDQFLSTLLRWNLIVVALNLLPIKPLDGHEAWPLLKKVFQDWRRQKFQARREQLSAITRKKIEEFERLEANLKPNQPNPEVKEMIDQIIQKAAAEHKAKNQVPKNKAD